ncbi:MAG: hypothetical protein MZU95_02110 [Desulfomicrobium escambiense]|nr:hypothetical protein [Desulfomicrobium escambiense]
MKPYPFDRRGGQLGIGFSLPPGGSLLLCVKDAKARPAAAAAGPVWQEVARRGRPGGRSARPERPDARLLRSRLSAAGPRRTSIFTTPRGRPSRPTASSAIPGTAPSSTRPTSWTSDKFPADSGFEAVFGFRAVKGDARDFSDLKAVVERPALFRVFVNGQGSSGPRRRMVARPGLRRLPGGRAPGLGSEPDHGQGQAVHHPLRARAGLLSSGTSASCRRRPGLRDPSARAAGRRFLEGPGLAVLRRRGPLHPDLRPSPRPRRARPYRLELGSWLGATAEVFVNGRRAGTAAFPPYRARPDRRLSSPAGTRSRSSSTARSRTRSDPFHNAPPLGRAWPGSFQQGAEGGLPPERSTASSTTASSRISSS